MKEIRKTKDKIKKYQAEVIKQMLKLSTSGFGLVAALAWNELIKAFINDYIKTKIGVGSGILSLVIYAVLVTTLAVVVTLQLARLAKRVEKDGKNQED